MEGFFWLAGLAGHGVAAGYSVGLLAASLVLQESPGPGPDEFSAGPVSLRDREVAPLLFRSTSSRG